MFNEIIIIIFFKPNESVNREIIIVVKLIVFLYTVDIMLHQVTEQHTGHSLF